MRLLGLHLIHLNIYSQLPKIDELCNIAKCSNVVLIGITETKLDNKTEVITYGYRIVFNDRNRKGEGVACYIRSNIFYLRETGLPDNLENILIDILSPKTNPIFVDIIYKPPSQTWFSVQMITEFEALELNNELYILGDFNINVPLKGKCLFNKIHETENHCKNFSPKIKIYKESCSIYGFK